MVIAGNLNLACFATKDISPRLAKTKAIALLLALRTQIVEVEFVHHPLPDRKRSNPPHQTILTNRAINNLASVLVTES